MKLMLAGCGPHARRFHLPALRRLNALDALSVVVECEARVTETRHLLEAMGARATIVGVDPKRDRDPVALAGRLASVTNEVDGLIVATEPMSHMQYVLWAFERGIHVLLDKPVTTRQDAANDPRQADGILEDTHRLCEALRAAGEDRVGCSVLAHRRWHPLFRHAMECVRRVCGETGCPVTAIHAHHSDGQWRLPDEMLRQEHHSYHHGHGKLSHSGHHFIDQTVQWWEAGSASGKPVDEVRASVEEIDAAAVAWQVDDDVYRRVFGARWDPGRMAAVAAARLARCGEIDVEATLALRSAGRNVGLASLSLLHNGVSQRAWPVAATDLYKGNGRIKHEHHRVHVGPFLGLHINSIQAVDEHDRETAHDDELGGRNHAELTLFRNHRMVGGKRIERMRLADCQPAGSGLRIEAVKQAAVAEFLDLLSGKITPRNLRSPLQAHRPSVRLLAALYRSIAQGRHGQSRDVLIPWTGNA